MKCRALPQNVWVEDSPWVPGAPRRLDASEVLEGPTPDDVCEAVAGVEINRTCDERTEAVARIVRRRRQASVRVREEEAYSVH